MVMVVGRPSTNIWGVLVSQGYVPSISTEVKAHCASRSSAVPPAGSQVLFHVKNFPVDTKSHQRLVPVTVIDSSIFGSTLSLISQI
jgi:hypothetical protein